MTERLILGSPQWFWPAVIFFAVVTCWMIVSYILASRRSAVLFLGLLLKIVGFALLLAVLLEPMVSGQRPRSQANYFAVLVDNSQSMLIGENTSGEVAKPVWSSSLEDTQAWQTRLAQDFQVRRYRFDSQLQSTDSFVELNWKGSSSRLNRSLQDLSDRYADRPLAGVLLMTDGNATDSESQPSNWSKLGVPVYPIVYGTTKPVQDINLERVSVTQTDFEASPVTIDAQLSAIGFQGKKANLDLLDSEGKEIQTATIEIPADREIVHHRFQFRPAKTGVQGFQIRSRLAEEANLGTKDLSIESTLLNNQRYAVVDRGLGPYRILYLAGRPNWEFKFLRRAVDADAELKLVGLLRIARKEPKFSFRDSKVDSANPLFSGFEDLTEEEKANYDEPVLIRLGVEESDQLSKGFPKTAEELFSYHAIILDDIEHDFFTQEQLLLMRQFVAVRGGGLMVLGGQETLRGKALRESPLGELIPVYPDDSLLTTNTKPEESQWKWELTREGWLQPWLRLTDNEVAERKLLQERIPGQVLNRVEGIKPGASVLAEGTDETGQKAPIMASQKFGKGKTAALMAGDLWRWAMHRQGEGESPLLTSWRQTIRWLIADVPKRVTVDITRAQSGKKSQDDDLVADVPAGTTRLRSVVLDEEFKPIDNATVTFEVQTPQGKKLVLQAEPSTSVPGGYESSLVNNEEGVFQVEVKAAAADGSTIGSNQAGWTSEPSAEEFEKLIPNEQYLKQIAEQSGGEIVQGSQLDRFVSGLTQRAVPVSETFVYPLWHEPWVAILAISCLCAEWGLRRFNGLA